MSGPVVAILIIVGIVSFVALIAWLIPVRSAGFPSLGTRKPKVLLERPLATEAWAALPVSRASVDHMLDMFCDDYDLGLEARKRILPTDTMQGIYDMIYTDWKWGDQMEGVELLMGLENAIGSELPDDCYDRPLSDFVEMLEICSN